MRRGWLWPALVALVVCGGFAAIRLARSGWDAEALANVGTRFSTGDPAGTEGYDGQFVLYVARDLNPETVAAHLDRPAYRYQRILLPLLARLAAFGNPAAIPWALLGLGIGAQFAGTLAVASTLGAQGRRPGYALSYGLWAGLVVGVGVFLHEPLAYGLVAAGWALRIHGRRSAGAVLLGLALFAKETTIAFAIAALVEDLLGPKENRRSSIWLIGSGVLFGLWQLWLWRTFGELGLGSGGAESTPFEWVPLMGLIRVGLVDVRVLALYIAIFGPTMVVPAIWATYTAVRDILRRNLAGVGGALLLNAALILFMPFSSFREPLAILRLGSGLVLATLLYAAARGRTRVLNYSLLWCALLAVLVNG